MGRLTSGYTLLRLLAWTVGLGIGVIGGALIVLALERVCTRC